MTFKNYKKKKQKQHQELMREARQEVIKRIGKVYQQVQGKELENWWNAGSQAKSDSQVEDEEFPFE